MDELTPPEWISDLPEPDRLLMLGEVVAQAELCAQEENFEPLLILLQQWQNTSEVHADPEILARLKGEAEDDDDDDFECELEQYIRERAERNPEFPRMVEAAYAARVAARQAEDRLLDQANQSFADLREEPQAFAEYQAEMKAWDDMPGPDID